jgi:transcriptional regulator with XRE-family HTH domain
MHDKSRMRDIALMRKLRIRRKVLEMSQRELAEISGYGRERISHWEQGHRLPNISQFEDLAKALGLRIALVEDDES